MKLSTALKTMIAAGLFLSGVTAAAEPASATFTPAQEARIGEIAKNYLLEHPDILLQVSQKLQAQQLDQRIKTMSAAALQHQTDLLHDKGTPAYGPQDARVTVVEFFDYQCLYCSRLAPILEEIMKANPDVRFVFKEWPIFGQRWENSLLAARTGLQIFQQKGAEAYVQYHNAIYATGHDEGALTVADIHTAASAVKFATNKAADVQTTLEGINTLAQQIGFTGTPGLVILPSAGATSASISVIPGFSSAADIQAAISKAAASGSKNR